MADTTTIQILTSQWSDLNAAKEAPGESMKDALTRVLDVYKQVEENDIDLDALLEDEPAPDERPADETPVDLEADSVREREAREDVVDDRDVATDERTDVERGPLTSEQAAAVDDAIDAVASEKWDDDGRVPQRRRAARAAVEYLAEHDVASKKEVRREVEPEYPVDEQDGRTWYRRTVRPVFNRVAEYNSSKRGYEMDVGGPGD